ncbi:hypothetical protein OsJ_36730 [Oryza sativa Japonica Group]|uniref:F-box/LRR-repeat protein 15/At3g58940/PEG3-like LRR domain-containing protein n=1 Tax=Oryza sativa subsp. japonica TaxID=39947 RepID=A3CJ25_ORYSJ|nr:hypothetical protein OsJ_36730 [Oryza sativa Japonica Group]
MDHESIVASDLSIYPLPPGTRTLATPRVVLAPPPVTVVNQPHADWRGLPDAAVSRVLDRLPVVDLFRLGYLFSPRWLHIWRARPLYLHDRQFTTPPIPAANVANAITNVLHHHVGEGVQLLPVQGGGGGGGGQGEGALVGGGDADEAVTSDDEIYEDEGIIQNAGHEIGRVYCLRVETTRWSLDHLVRWCAELQRGGARVLMLANLAIPEHPELPQAILNCGASHLGLHVFFFTVEAYHIAALVELRALGLYGCIEGHGMIDRVLHPESPIRKLAIHGGMGRTFAVAGATRLRSLVLFDNQVGTVAVDGAARFRNLYMSDTKPSRIRIGAAPRLRRILSLDIFNTVLVIQGLAIQIGMMEPPPQIRSVRHLCLRVNYTEMDVRLPRLMEQILKSFPRVKSLDIMRCDDVTQAEGLLQWNDAHYDGNNFFDGLESFNYHLRWIYLEDFRGGKCEVALMKAMLDKASVLRQLMIQYSTSSVPQLTLNQLDLSLQNFKLHTLNGAIRGNLVSFVAADASGSCRDDEVTVAEGLLKATDEHIYKGNNFFHGLRGFRGGKRELALIKAILDEARAGTRLRMEYSTRSNPELTMDQLDQLVSPDFRAAHSK